MSALLEIRNLTFDYHTQGGIIHALRNVSLSLNEGETLGLVGETGAGKTTTALSVLRLHAVPPGDYKNGEIIYDGRDIMKMKKEELHKIRGEEISMIFQDPMTALNPVMTVEKQVAEVIKNHEKISWQEAKVKAGEMLEMVGIPAIRGQEFPHQFSGGMKQRIVIAIALARSPRILLADEPTTALDVTIQRQVLELVQDLKERLNTSMLLITHDLGVVAETCDRVAIMYAGEIIEEGSLEDIFEHVAHPYSVGLFGSIPDLEKKVKRLNPIPGMMPNPTSIPKGCSFSPRCPHKCSECENIHPELKEISPRHHVRCIRYDERKESWQSF